MLSGFINLYKPKGVTSNKILGILKYQLKQSGIVTKIGHFGTLDPMAEGVLPVALGRATRLFDYSLKKEKIYTASFLFGKETTTLDSEGECTYEESVDITKEQILQKISTLVGTYEQIPPNYSAKSINGVRAYKLARQGVEFQLKGKLVTIFSIELLEKIAKNEFSFRIICSGGTYIRSIARDLGEALGTKGIMTSLLREKSGEFTLETAKRVEEIDFNCDILPMEIMLEKFPKVDVPKIYEKKLLNGVHIKMDNLPNDFFVVVCDSVPIGIGMKNQEGNLRINTWLLH